MGIFDKFKKDDPIPEQITAESNAVHWLATVHGQLN
jgi:hypothetical protein